MTEITHTIHSSFVGTGTCAKCGAGITHIYAARNNTTGKIETFGSDCHYQVTGVDTRQAVADHRRTDRTARNTTRIPAADLDLHAKLTPIVNDIWGDRLTGVTPSDSFLLCTLRNWVTDWDTGTRALAEWLDDILRNPEVTPETAARFAEAAGIDLTKITGKMMDARFPGRCATCDAKIRRGDRIVYANGAAHCATHAG